MATPTYSDVITQLNTFIKTNGNNEITAAVLNPVLKFITDFANNHMGDLSNLTTSETDNLVDAINSLKEDLNNSSNNAVKLYTGVDNPNDVPPPSFNYADFYMQIDFLTSDPITLWQWNGFEWKDSSSIPATESDNVANNSSVPGMNVTDALNNLNSFSGVFESIDYPRLISDQQDFTIPTGKTAKWATVNYAFFVPETTNNVDEFNTFTQSGNIVSFKETLVTGNYPVIFYQ